VLPPPARFCGCARIVFDCRMANDLAMMPSTRWSDNQFNTQKWDFLPRSRAKVIAEQLTYLDFHEWLMNNLRHSSEPQPNAAAWSSLGLTVAEGFYKTDVVLYASICEVALYAVLRSVYVTDPAGAQ